MIFEPQPFDSSRPRRELLEIAERAVASVMPSQAVANAVVRDGSALVVGGRRLNLGAYDRVLVLGFGKAACSMGQAFLPLLRGVPTEGLLVTPAPSPVEGLAVLPGSHPVPTEESVAGGRRLLQMARSAGERDLAVLLISGGGSAVAEVPAGGLTLDDLQATTRCLLRCGATINELNAVRKHLSAFKGGRLAQALASAQTVVTLIISDVIGAPLDVIASGPTVADPTTYADARSVIERYALEDQVPKAVLHHLREGEQGRVAETPKTGLVFGRQSTVVIASGDRAATVAADAARRLGHDARVVQTDLQGEAREVARALVRAADALGPGQTFVYAGETTVTVTGDGQGGRNQELALAAAIALAGRDDVTVLSLGTDGIDGMSPSAGAFGDGAAVERGRALGLDAVACLDRNDSHRFMRAIGYTVDSGPTGTNVGDLVLVHRHRL